MTKPRSRNRRRAAARPVRLGLGNPADLDSVPLGDHAVAAVRAVDLQVVAPPGERRPRLRVLPPADDQLGSAAESVVAPGRYG